MASDESHPLQCQWLWDGVTDFQTKFNGFSTTAIQVYDVVQHDIGCGLKSSQTNMSCSCYKRLFMCQEEHHVKQRLSDLRASPNTKALEFKVVPAAGCWAWKLTSSKICERWLACLQFYNIVIIIKIMSFKLTVKGRLPREICAGPWSHCAPAPPFHPKTWLLPLTCLSHLVSLAKARRPLCRNYDLSHHHPSSWETGGSTAGAGGRPGICH